MGSVSKAASGGTHAGLRLHDPRVLEHSSMPAGIQCTSQLHADHDIQTNGRKKLTLRTHPAKYCRHAAEETAPLPSTSSASFDSKGEEGWPGVSYFAS